MTFQEVPKRVVNKLGTGEGRVGGFPYQEPSKVSFFFSVETPAGEISPLRR